MSGVRMTRHYLPAMTKRSWGRVVFISSESALAIPKEMIDYGMTKTAQLAIARGVAESVAGTGVTVNSVLPGPTNSEILSNWMKANAEAGGITQAQAEKDFLKTMRPTSLLRPLHDDRRGCEHGRLSLLGTGFRHDWRRTPR